jgi:O-antigen ligase
MEIHQTSRLGSNSRGWLLITGLALVALLLFIWPVPRTISLRDLLLVVCLGLFAYLAYRSSRRESFRWQSLRVPFGLYLVLSVWIVFVAIAISEETAWSLDEIRGQWLKATIALVAGGLLGAAIRNDDSTLRLTLTIIGVALLLHVLYVVYQALSVWPRLEITPTRVAGLTEGSDKSNYLTNMLLYFLLAEIIVRSVFHRRFLPVGNVPLAVITMVALFAVYAEAMRNGIAELAIVLGVAVILVMRESDRTRRLAIAGIAFTLVVIALTQSYLNVGKDERWQTFLETVPIAMDIENKAWINEALPQPRLANGQTVDWSNYMRIARMRAGVSLMADYPLGVGFGRNAFGHAVEKKYGMRTSHSHSGIIDLGAGIGVPGVLLWLGFLGVLLRLGYRGLCQSHSFPALALLFLTAGYSFRMLVDSTIRDHMLQMFLFLAAFLAVIVAGQLHGQQRETPAPASA